MVDAAADVDPALLPVDILVTQALGLAAAAAGIIDQEGKQAEVVVQVVLDLLDLISGRRVAVLLRKVLREKNCLRSVKRDVTFALGFIQDLSDDLALGDNGLLCVGLGKLVDVRLNLFACDRGDILRAKLRDGALIGRGIIAQGIRRKRWLDLVPPGVGDVGERDGLWLLGFGAVGLDLVPDLAVRLAAKRFALAVDCDDGFMQAVRPDVVFGNWHRKTSKNTALALGRGGFIYARTQPILGLQRSTRSDRSATRTMNTRTKIKTSLRRASTDFWRMICSCLEMTALACLSRSSSSAMRGILSGWSSSTALSVSIASAIRCRADEGTSQPRS